MFKLCDRITFCHDPPQHRTGSLSDQLFHCLFKFHRAPSKDINRYLSTDVRDPRTATGGRMFPFFWRSFAPYHGHEKLLVDDSIMRTQILFWLDVTNAMALRGSTKRKIQSGFRPRLKNVCA